MLWGTILDMHEQIEGKLPGRKEKECNIKIREKNLVSTLFCSNAQNMYDNR